MFPPKCNQSRLKDPDRAELPAVPPATLHAVITDEEYCTAALALGGILAKLYAVGNGRLIRVHVVQGSNISKYWTRFRGTDRRDCGPGT
jgi:hypothetical protein